MHSPARAAKRPTATSHITEPNHCLAVTLWLPERLTSIPVSGLLQAWLILNSNMLNVFVSEGQLIQ